MKQQIETALKDLCSSIFEEQGWEATVDYLHTLSDNPNIKWQIYHYNLHDIIEKFEYDLQVGLIQHWGYNAPHNELRVSTYIPNGRAYLPYRQIIITYIEKEEEHKESQGQV